MKEKDVPLAVPLQVFCYCVLRDLRGTEPSEKCVLCISDFSSLAQLAFQTWAHWTDKALIYWLRFVRHRRHSQPWGCFQHKRFTHTHTLTHTQRYIYIISLSDFTSASCCRFFQDTSGTFRAWDPSDGLQISSHLMATETLEVGESREMQCVEAESVHNIPTYGGWLRNPAPVDRWFLPLFIGFQPSKAVQDFFHPQYVCTY